MVARVVPIALVALLALSSVSQLGTQIAHNLSARAQGEAAVGAQVGSRAEGALGGATRSLTHAADAANVLAAATWQNQVANALALAPRFADSARDGIPVNLRARQGSAFMLQEYVQSLIPQEQRALQISAGSERPITPYSVRTEFQGRQDRFGRVVTLSNENPRALALSTDIEGEFTYVGVKRGIMIGCCGPAGGVCCGVPANPQDFGLFLESIASRLEPGGVAVLQGAVQSSFLTTTSRKLHVDAARLFAEANPQTTTFMLAEGIDSGLAIVNAPPEALLRLPELESSTYLREFLDL